MGYRFNSIIYLHGYTVTKVSATFAAQPPPLRVVSSEQVAHPGSSGQRFRRSKPCAFCKKCAIIKKESRGTTAAAELNRQ